MNFDHVAYKQSFMESLSSQMNLNSSSDDGESENKSSGDNKKIDYVHKRMEEVLKGKKDTTPTDDTINLKE